MLKLSPFEKVTVSTNQDYPVNIVAILDLIDGPTPDVLVKAIELVKNRHPLLKVKINLQSFSPSFAHDDNIPLDFNVFQIDSEYLWHKKVEEELERFIDIERGPLYSFHYYYNKENGGVSTLIFTFHHSITDGGGLANLQHEILANCESINSNVPILFEDTVPLVPSPVKKFPKSITGIRNTWKLGVLMASQIWGEISYRLKTKNGKQFKVSNTTDNRIAPIMFTVEETKKLQQAAHNEKLNLNSIINAALMIVVWRKVHNQIEQPVRTFTFTDLRTLLIPKSSFSDTRPHTTMYRISTFMGKDATLVSVARDLNKQIYRALKRGDHYLLFALSDKIIKIVIADKKNRIASTALSYSGKIGLAEKYGNIRVKHLNAFTSTPAYGPIFSGLAGMLHQSLFIDLVFRAADMSPEVGQAGAEEIKKLLLAFSQ